jgi:hypothetical protein
MVPLILIVALALVSTVAVPPLLLIATWREYEKVEKVDAITPELRTAPRATAA